MRIIGIDLGKISFKAVWLENQNGKWEIKETFWKVHRQEIMEIWQELKAKWQIKQEDKVILTGKLRQMLPFPSIVEKVAQEETVKFLYPNQDLTLIRLGGGGFSVLRVRKSGPSEFRQNPRCASGVGSFLDQIMARVDLDIIKADQLVGDVKGVEITSRCGVTMKTDLTHLLNTGHKLEEVVAGLLDSSAKNAAALALKSEVSFKVLVIGGLSVSKRIVRTIQEKMPEGVKVEVPDQSLYFEALGAALIGRKIENQTVAKPESSSLVFFPGLKNYLNLVTKIKLSENKEFSSVGSFVMGLDIGSTGSKIVIFGKEPVFEAYTPTKGNPVEAAKNLVQNVPQRFLERIKGIGCTGSGREIVANLLKASLDEKDRNFVFVLNEIAAHAEGAQYYDKEVDTVVDIGGQDAKFTRLESGRVVDSCMNTVCSAGTGSFLAEQLQLLGIKDVKEFGRIALESPRAVDLGQHCAVFISEHIDDAKRKGAVLEEIVTGLYYSIVQNYNNRVKGFRDYGKKIFLQGKPAENIALACALAKVTGNPIIVPPSPGTPGALGIALLAKKELNLERETFLDLNPFLKSEILEKKEFRCHSKEGCIVGNLCPIQSITVKVGEKNVSFFWGGSCDKYEKNLKKNLAMAKAPRTFMERENLILRLLEENKENSVGTIGIPRGLETEEILPLSITFFQELGFKINLEKQPSVKALEEGAKLCQTTFCAPLQLLAGQAKLSEKDDFIFLPKIIEISGSAVEPDKNRCYTCPLSQAMPDLFSPKLSTKVLQPLLDFKKSIESNRKAFVKMGFDLGCSEKETISAFEKAVKNQKEFEKECRKIGERALEFAKEHKIPVVVVLGHPYIINSSLLSAGIPEAIQDNGAIALSASCYPWDKQSGLFKDIYWGYGQRLLQSSWQIRRQPGVYPLWLSVYSCGPDSFLIHFFQYLVYGKPYAILESDAYTGQAGFKTRVEAFLYGIKHYQEQEKKTLPDFSHFRENDSVDQIIASNRKLLAPWLGEVSGVLTGFFRSAGIESETLPKGDQEDLELGRKYTSGKECLPMIITLGGLLKYLEAHPNGDFYYFMPQASGPCRFGQYQRLFKIVLEKLNLSERVKIISPTSETGYEYGLKIGSAAMAKVWALAATTDFLKDALHDIRPEEKTVGETQQVFDKYIKQAEELASEKNNNWFNLKDLWGLKSLAEKAAKDFQSIPRDSKKQGKPTVLVTGEIYVRLDSFANNDVIKELEKLGVKVKLSPFREWGNYVSYSRKHDKALSVRDWLKKHLIYWFQRKIEAKMYKVFANTLNWSKDHRIEDILETARPYLSELKPDGEAALTIGLPLLLWRKKEIQGTVIVGPFECMPTRVGETQLNLISQRTGLPVLTLSFHGESLERDALESFIWDLKK